MEDNRGTWGDNIILAIETTGQQCSVALIDEWGKLRQESSVDQLNHLTNLIPMIDKIIKDNEFTINDVKAIAVSEGPGSFTGIRIGVSTARALAQTLNLPTVGVPTLRTFIEPYLGGDYPAKNLGKTKGDQLLICPMFDARREEIYGAAYLLCWDADDIPVDILPVDIIPQGAYDLNTYFGFLKEYLNKRSENCIQKKETRERFHIKFMGDGAIRYGQQIDENMSEITDSSSNGDMTYDVETGKKAYQSAEKVAKLALKLYNEKAFKKYEDLHPVYLRKAEAERKLEQGLL